jgi:hypothetical protein
MRTRAAIVALAAALSLSAGAATLASAAAPDDIAAYQGSEVHRALGLQYALGNDVGMQDIPWVGTHNTFNSVAEMGRTLSDTDPNQKLSITQLLDIDVRTVELDVHLVFSPRAPGTPVPVVCHAQDTGHAGCSAEKTLGPVLDEIAGWLRGHARTLIRLRIEDHLDGAAGQAMAARLLSDHLGTLLYRPPAAAQCVPPPADLTRAKMLAAGAQVFLQGDCKGASGLRAVAWANGAYEEERPMKYTDFPRCGPTFKRADYTRKIIRYYEDSTQLTKGASRIGAATVDDGMTPATTAAMARCGVDLIEFDQLTPTDGRLAAAVWSWGPGQPAASGSCAVQVVGAASPFGRWQARPCTERHRVACRNRAGNWHVAAGPPLVAAAGAKRCRRPGTNAAFAVPRTGYEAQRLRLAMAAAHTGQAWLGYRRAGAGWRALDPR